MTSLNQPVTSREYKLMLRPEHFESRAEGAVKMWALVTYLAARYGGEVDEPQNKEEMRQTQYWDTPVFGLRHYGYALRLRHDDEYTLTLKYSGRDRYVAAARDLSGPVESKSKFEEDILPTYRNFAQSTSIEEEVVPKLTMFADAIAYFPGLEQLPMPTETPLQLVNNFNAYEVVRWIGKLRFGETAVVKVCLSFWYMTKSYSGIPLVAELSFDYDLPNRKKLKAGQLEFYPISLVEGVNCLFTALQRQNAWVDMNGTTKTAFAYNGF